MIRDLDFCIVWFPVRQDWLVMFSDGSVLPGGYDKPSSARDAAMIYTGHRHERFRCDEAAAALYKLTPAA